MLVAAGVLAIPLGLAGLRPIKATAEGSDAVLPVPPESASPAPLDSLALLVVNHDPFRLTRSPAAIAYSPAPVEPVYVEPPPPKPQLVLTGIVWGDEPSAIVEGLPGIEGARVLRVGESSGSVRIRRITRQDVTLVGLDTTWVLQVRKPW
jgi:hypothetical protein